MEKEQNWVLNGLKKYWKKQAEVLDFDAFTFRYIELMLLKNRETGLAFWYFIRERQNDTLLEVYMKLRK